MYRSRFPSYVASVAALLIVGLGAVLAPPGVAGQAGSPGPARDAPCSPLDLPDLPMAIFEDGEGGLRSLIGFDHGGHRGLMYTDHAWGFREPLTESDGGVFHAGPEGARVEVRFRCADGRLSAVHAAWDGDTVRAARVPVGVEPVAFEGDGVTLAGRLFTPVGDDPAPGMVYVHGSGPSTHHDFGEFGLLFAARGIVSLAFDKRGAGESTGDWESANFKDLASDAAAALEHLRARPEVSGRVTGFFGASQGAWVAPIASAGSDPDFLILSGGGPVTPARQELYRRVLLVEESGAAPEEVEQARQALETYFEYLRDPEGRSAEMAAAWPDIAEASWRRTVGIPPRNPTLGEWPEVRRRFARELHFDPVPHYRAVEVPMLGILGLEDQAFPVAETLAAWNLFPAEMDITVVGIPAADHGWFVVPEPGRRIQAPEAFRAVQRWIHGLDEARRRAAEVNPGRGMR